VVGISGADGATDMVEVGHIAALVSLTRSEPLRFGRIVVIGGGCYGSWYTQQLTRATQRGALIADQVVVVDRNPDCLVVQRAPTGVYAGLPLRVVRSTWREYMAEWLSVGSAALQRDALVPSPLMPHLCLDWLMDRAQARWPERIIQVDPLPKIPNMPWERASPDGRHYVSFATWMCPVNCIEPARCPATRGERSWSMPPALEAYVNDLATETRADDRETLPLRGPVIFHCVHRTYGVGMVAAAAIARADEQIALWGDTSPVSVLVGTVSHCHGALGVLAVS